MSSGRRFAYFFLGSLGSTAAGFGAGLPWLLPVLGALVPYPVFLRELRAGRPGAACRAVLLWALLQSLVLGGAVRLAPDRAAGVVHRGPAYAAEMIHWIETGEGPEGSPRLYLPVHLRHYAAFCALSFLTAGAASLVLGTWLLNYMNYYVVVMAGAAAAPAPALALGWPPWAVLRVVGFVATGAALAGFALAWLNARRGGPALPHPRALLAVGIGFVVADAVLKWLLAPAWRTWLLSVFQAAG
jgi:hypothetical protein